MQKLPFCPLSLKIWTAEHPWKNSLASIRGLPCLESLSLTSTNAGVYAADSLLLPYFCLQAMSTLKLLGLKGCILREQPSPAAGLPVAPRHCLQLQCIAPAYSKHQASCKNSFPSRGEGSRVACIKHPNLSLQQFMIVQSGGKFAEHLNLAEGSCTTCEATLLYRTHLHVSAETWKSLEVIGVSGFDILSSDIDSFISEARLSSCFGNRRRGGKAVSSRVHAAEMTRV